MPNSPEMLGTTELDWPLSKTFSAELLSLALMLFQALTATATAVTPVVANELTEKFALSGSQIGLLSSLYLMMFCLGGIPMGMAVARWGGRMMAVSVVLVAGGSVLFALSASYGWFFLARMLQGLGGAACVPVANTLISRTVPPEKQGRALGIFGAGLGFGYLFALAALPSLQEAGGYRTVFMFLAILSILVGAVLFLRPEVRSAATHTGEEGSILGVARSLRRAAANPHLWVLAIMNMAAAGTCITLLTWTPSFLETQFGTSLAVAAYLTAGVAAAQLVGNPLGAVAMGRWGKIPVILVSLVGMAVLTAVLPLSPVLLLCFVIVMIAGFLSMAMFPAGIGIIPDVVKRPEEVGPATGLVLLLNIIGLMIPPWLFGKLLDVYGTSPGDQGYLAGYLMLAAFPFAGIVATVVFCLMPAATARSEDEKKGSSG